MSRIVVPSGGPHTERPIRLSDSCPDETWDEDTDPELVAPSPQRGRMEEEAGSDNLCVRLSPPELRALARHARNAGVNRQELIRRWIRRGCP